MKKLVSLVLAMVLMVSMFALLGTVTASAETYVANNTLVNLTFDGDAPYGIVAHRGISDIVYNEAGYVEIHNLNGNGSMAFFGKDGTVGAAPVTRSNTDDISQFTVAQLEAYNNLFMFEAGKNYKITFDYKVLAGTTNSQAKPSFNVYSNPLLKTADSVRKLIDENDPSSARVLNASINGSTEVPQINYTLTNGVLAKDTDWATVEITFTTKDDETGFCFGLYAGYAAGKDSICAFDNFKVKEVLDDSYNYNDSGVYTMDNKPTFKTGDKATVVYIENYDAEHGTVLKLNANGSATARGGFENDDFKMTSGNKYYFTFDAKADSAETDLQVVMTYLEKSTECRYFLCGRYGKNNGVQYFIDGNAIDVQSGQAKSMPLSTDWQTYGFIIDTTDESFITELNKYNPNFWTSYYIHMAFGASGTTYFDNVQLIAISDFSEVVDARDASTKYSIRKESNEGTYVSAGLRFRGTVETAVKEDAEEIGFVIAPVEAIAGDADWYKIPTLNKAARPVVAFDNTKDVIYGTEANGYSYQLALKGLSNEQGQNFCDRRFAAVIYVKTDDAYTYISLGEISYSEVAAEYAVRGK